VWKLWQLDQVLSNSTLGALFLNKVHTVGATTILQFSKLKHRLFSMGVNKFECLLVTETAGLALIKWKWTRLLLPLGVNSIGINPFA